MHEPSQRLRAWPSRLNYYFSYLYVDDAGNSPHQIRSPEPLWNCCKTLSGSSPRKPSHAYPVPGPRSQFPWRSSAIGFLPPPGGNLAHAPAFYQPLPAHGSSALAVRASSYVDRMRHFARQHSRPPARRAGRRLLLLLQRIARAQRLRKDVRTSQIRQPLVGHHLRQAAPAKARRRLQRWPALASPRPRRTRPVAKLSGPAGIPRNKSLDCRVYHILFASTYTVLGLGRYR